MADGWSLRRTIWWDGQQVAVVDQRQLPHRVAIERWRTVDQAADGIRQMQDKVKEILQSIQQAESQTTQHINSM